MSKTIKLIGKIVGKAGYNIKKNYESYKEGVSEDFGLVCSECQKRYINPKKSEFDRESDALSESVIRAANFKSVRDVGICAACIEKHDFKNLKKHMEIAAVTLLENLEKLNKEELQEKLGVQYKNIITEIKNNSINYSFHSLESSSQKLSRLDTIEKRKEELIREITYLIETGFAPYS